MEDTVLHTTQSLTVTGSKVAGGEGLVTRGIVHEFWGMAQDEVLAVLRNTCVSASLLSAMCITRWQIVNQRYT